MSSSSSDAFSARRKAVFKGAVQAAVDGDLLPATDANRRLALANASPGLLQQFRRYAWAARSAHVRQWLLAVLVFDLALIAFDWTINPSLIGPSLLVRGIGVTGVFAYLYALWGQPRSDDRQAVTLVLVAITIMSAAGVLGALGGPVTFERYLTAGLFTVATGVVHIPVSLAWAVAGIAATIAVDAAFLIFDPFGPPLPAFLMLGFYAAAVLSLAAARQMASDGLWQSFLARVREARDQQELTRLNAELRIAAEIDPLTGIPNRRSAQSHIDRLWRDEKIQSAGIAFVMADIDYFKLLNDTRGHAAGDSCIQAVAGAIRSTLRDGDIVSRHGGEEFLVVLGHTTLNDAAAVAERMRRAVKDLAIVHPGIATSPFVTISIGVAMARERSGCERAMSRADEALYEAKRNGRDRVVIAPDDMLTRGPRTSAFPPALPDRAA